MNAMSRVPNKGFQHSDEKLHGDTPVNFHSQFCLENLEPRLFLSGSELIGLAPPGPLAGEPFIGSPAVEVPLESMPSEKFSDWLLAVPHEDIANPKSSDVLPVSNENGRLEAATSVVELSPIGVVASPSSADSSLEPQVSVVAGALAANGGELTHRHDEIAATVSAMEDAVPANDASVLANEAIWFDLFGEVSDGTAALDAVSDPGQDNSAVSLANDESEPAVAPATNTSLAAPPALATITAVPFYQLDLIAQTGQSNLVTLGEYPSLNELGTVAFVGRYADGSGVFIGSGAGAAPTNVNPTFSHTPGRFFSPAVDINDDNRVLSIDQFPSDPSTLESRLRLWRNDPNDPFLTIVSEGATDPPENGPLTSITTFVSLNVLGDAAFVGVSADGVTSLELHVTGTQRNQAVRLDQFADLPDLRPAISDNRAVVVRAGDLPTSPIKLYRGRDPPVTIADATMFFELGRSPGISPDGTIVVFYGNLRPEAAISLTTANGEVVPFPLTPGPGVFASVEANGKRFLVRIGGVAHNGYVEPGERQPVGTGDDVGPDFNFDLVPEWEIGAFDADARISVADGSVSPAPSPPDGTGGRSIQVAFLAKDVRGTPAEAIFNTRVNLIGNAGQLSGIGVEAYRVVAKVGQNLKSFGTVTDLNIYDAVNESGQIAFWAARDGGQAIVRASPTRQMLMGDKEVTKGFVEFAQKVNARSRFAPDSPLVQYVIAGIPSGSRNTFNQVVVHATVGNDPISLKALALPDRSGISIHYLVTREGRVIQVVPENKVAGHAAPINRTAIGIELVDDCVISGNDCAPMTGHRDNPEWFTPIQQQMTALLIRDIALRRGIPLVHPEPLPYDISPALNGDRLLTVPFNNFGNPDFLEGNANPIAARDAFAADVDTALAIPITTILANDRDGDSPTRDNDGQIKNESFKIVPQNMDYEKGSLKGPFHGKVEIKDNQVIYTPDAGFAGADIFTYTVTDTEGAAVLNEGVVAIAVGRALVTSYSVTAGGSGYTSAPAVTITGGGGSGAAAEAVIENGTVKELRAISVGSGYTSDPTVTISGGGTEARAVGQRTAATSIGSVKALQLVTGGSGYTPALTVTIVGGGGAGAKAQATIKNGVVTKVTLTKTGNGNSETGYGYATDPQVVFVGGGGSGAAALATRSTTPITTQDAPAPKDFRVRDGFDTRVRGIISHGQVINRTLGKDDARILPWKDGLFIAHTNQHLLLSIDGTVNISVVDPAGRRVASQFGSGSTLREIPDAVWTGAGSAHQVLELPHTDGSYTIEITAAQANTTFTANVFVSGAGGAFARTRLTNILSLGAKASYTLTYRWADAGRVNIRGQQNLPPAAFDDTAVTGYTTSARIRPLINDNDPDGSPNPATLIIVRAPEKGGTATVDPLSGIVTYTPPKLAAGKKFANYADSFTYTVQDGQGAISNEATVRIGVHSATPITAQQQNAILGGLQTLATAVAAL
ncbi:MAG: N-acetylmuramoyl-L-alanine amidase [Pedosphaera sp.]|nr:N-acetylmuramoyl-L-alanine amidase [Pedosphaera sp.]